MDKLPPHVEALLEQARVAHDPEPADRARVERALIATLAAGSAVGTAGKAAATAGAAGGGAGGGMLAIKVVAGIGLAGALALVVVRPWAGGDGADGLRAPRPAQATDVVSAVAPAASEVDRAAAGPSAVPSLEAAPESAQAAPAPAAVPLHANPDAVRGQSRAAAHRSRHRRGAKSPAEGAHRTVAPARARDESVSQAETAKSEATAASGAMASSTAAVEASASGPAATAPQARLGGSLEDELRLIRDADRALRGGAALKALGILREHEARFPTGTWGQERQGLWTLALCALGRAEATAARDAFLARHGSSPLAARVRNACGGPEE